MNAHTFADGEEFETYHIRFMVTVIHEDGLDAAKQKSAAERYDGLITATLRYMAACGEN
jgi:hypothetical protein